MPCVRNFVTNSESVISRHDLRRSFLLRHLHGLFTPNCISYEPCRHRAEREWLELVAGSGHRGGPTAAVFAPNRRALRLCSHVARLARAPADCPAGQYSCKALDSHSAVLGSTPRRGASCPQRISSAAVLETAKPADSRLEGLRGVATAERLRLPCGISQQEHVTCKQGRRFGGRSAAILSAKDETSERRTPQLGAVPSDAARMGRPRVEFLRQGNGAVGGNRAQSQHRTRDLCARQPPPPAMSLVAAEIASRTASCRRIVTSHCQHKMATRIPRELQ
jgi:hypothetical protein